MGTRYRVIVEQVDDVEGAQYETRETVLFEATLPRALRLASFAPDEVRAALMEAAGEDELAAHPQRFLAGIDRTVEHEPAAPIELRATVFNAAGDEISAAPQAPAAAEQGETPKRKRRTKAEIAADKAREAAEALQQHGERAAAEAGVDVEQLTAEAIASHNVPINDPQDVTSTTHPSQVVERPAEPQVPVAAPEPAAAAPAAPYNPFV